MKNLDYEFYIESEKKLANFFEELLQVCRAETAEAQTALDVAHKDVEIALLRLKDKSESYDSVYRTLTAIRVVITNIEREMKNANEQKKLQQPA